MANPTLTVTRTPAGVVSPGTPVTIMVEAADADARTASVTFEATDSVGNKSQVTEHIVISDPVTVTGTVSDPAGTATITRDVVDPRVWRVSV